MAEKKLAQDGGKFYAYIGGGNGLHHARKVLTSAGKRPYIPDEMNFGGRMKVFRRPRKDILRKCCLDAEGRKFVNSLLLERDDLTIIVKGWAVLALARLVLM